jgi:hypothetical protein
VAPVVAIWKDVVAEVAPPPTVTRMPAGMVEAPGGRPETATDMVMLVPTGVGGNVRLSETGAVCPGASVTAPGEGVIAADAGDDASSTRTVMLSRGNRIG